MAGEEAEQRTIAPGGSTIVETESGPVEVRAQPCPDPSDPLRPVWPRSALAIRSGERVVGLLQSPKEGEVTLADAAGLLARSGPRRALRMELTADPGDAAAHARLIEAAKAGGGNVEVVIPPVDVEHG